MIAVLVTLVVLTIVPAVVLALLGGRIFPQPTRPVRAAHARTEPSTTTRKTAVAATGRTPRKTKEHTTLVR
jgi:hypothetical protein